MAWPTEAVKATERLALQLSLCFLNLSKDLTWFAAECCCWFSFAPFMAQLSCRPPSLLPPSKVLSPSHGFSGLPAGLCPQGVDSSHAPAWPSWLSLDASGLSLTSGFDRFCCESLSALDGYPACFGDLPAVPAATARSPLELHLLQKASPKTVSSLVH